MKMTTEPHITPKIDVAIKSAAEEFVEKLLDMPIRAFQDYRTFQIVNLKVEDYDCMIDIDHLIMAVDLSLTATGAVESVEISLATDPDAVSAAEDDSEERFLDRHDMIAIALHSVVDRSPTSENFLARNIVGQARTIVNNRIRKAKFRRKLELRQKRSAEIAVPLER